MSKQKTFWEALQGKHIEHLWQFNPLAPDFRVSACGMVFGAKVRRGSAGGPGYRRCKSCERALKN